MTNRVLKNELQLTRWKSKFIGRHKTVSEKERSETKRNGQKKREPAFTL